MAKSLEEQIADLRAEVRQLRGDMVRVVDLGNQFSRKPAAQIAKVSALAPVMGRLLEMLGVPREVADFWKDTVLASDDNDLMSRANLEVFRELAPLQKRVAELLQGGGPATR